MAKTSNFNKEIRVLIDNELDIALKAQATRRKESVAEIVRRLLKESLAKEIAEDSTYIISTTIRKTIRSELKLTENRIAKLVAKTSIAAATSMFLNYAVIKEGNLGLKINSKELYEQARIKAVAYLRESGEKEDIEGGQ